MERFQEKEVNLHLTLQSRYNLGKFLDSIERWLRWQGHDLWMIFEYVLLKIWAQGEKKKTGKFYPFAVINESELCVFLNQLFHHKTWRRPEAISRLTRTLCIFIKRQHGKYFKNISLSLSKENCSLSTWCNNLKI